jgi:hypothetical protein
MEGADQGPGSHSPVITVRVDDVESGKVGAPESEACPNSTRQESEPHGGHYDVSVRPEAGRGDAGDDSDVVAACRHGRREQIDLVRDSSDADWGQENMQEPQAHLR